MKRIMLIGKSGSGKTTLLQRLKEDSIQYAKTQTLIFYEDFIDTPGEYLERKAFFSALLVTSVEAGAILLLQDAADKSTSFMPGMSGILNKPLIGIVTKIDTVEDKSQWDYAASLLKTAGAKEIFYISSTTGEGIACLKVYLDKITRETGKLQDVEG